MKDIHAQAARAAQEYFDESITVGRFVKDIYMTAYAAGYQAARAEALVEYAATRLKKPVKG